MRCCARKPVDRGHRVEALQQDALPLRGDGALAQQFLLDHPLLEGESAHAGSGEVEPARGSDQLRGVRNGGGEPGVLEATDALVDRAPRPAGDGDQLQPVEEGHRGQPAQHLQGARSRTHPARSSPGASGASPPGLRSRLLRCLRFLGCSGDSAGPSAACAPFLSFRSSPRPAR